MELADNSNRAYTIMIHPNQKIIDQFFEAYGKHDMDALRKVMFENVQWTFPGHHFLSGTKTGIDEVVDFFDKMGEIMGTSEFTIDKLIMGANDDYVVECHRVIMKRKDGNTLDHQWCVLWKFKNGKIKEGRHFASDQHEVDRFFHNVSREKIQ